MTDQLQQIKELLPDHLYAGSKDWHAGDVVDRVRWLLSMYEAKKEECEMWLDQIGIMEENAR